MKRPLIVLGFVLLFAVAFIVIGLYFIPRLRVKAELAGGLGDLLKSDADRVTRAAHIYVDITFATDEFLKRVRLDEYIGKYKYGQPFLVSLNTHAGNIEKIIDLEGKVFLIDDQGNVYPHLGSPIMTSLHHNTYMLIFPRVDHQGRSLFSADRRFFTIEVRDLPPFERREFRWGLPITPVASAGTPWEAWARFLMLAVALIGALTVTLSPCAINVSAFYSAVLATTLGRPDMAQRSDRAVKRELFMLLTPFAIGFIVLFSAGGALIGLTGSVLRNPLEQLGDYWPYIRIGAGLIMLYLGLKLVVLGLLKKGVGKLAVAVGQAWRRGLTKVFSLIAGEKLPEELEGLGERPFTPISSLLMGIAVSTECAICLGTGLFFPLAVYAGTTSWYWGMATLGAFSVTLVIPLFLVALGVRDLRLTLPRKVALVRTLNIVAGLIIGFVGMELVRDADPHRFTNFILDVVFGGTAWLYQ
jgi:cytochrome c biogenesis protein CcdA